jgi:hypothetical protein
MFKISQTTFRTLDDFACLEYYKRLAVILRRRFPDQTGEMDDAQLIKRIRAGHKAAKAHGVDTERAVGKWMVLDLLGGPEFYKSKELRALWDYPEASGEHKVDLLFDEVEKQTTQG